MQSKNKKRIAIITARGGSKRIPKKNIRLFCGKPILTYSIRAALDAGIFDKVMVSTDSEEIAQIAREAGADVPFMRSDATSGDYATTGRNNRNSFFIPALHFYPFPPPVNCFPNL